jgi:flagellar hook-length control protein FliK
VHGLIARIVTESAGVKHYLESNLSTLQHNLHEQGLKIDRIEFVVQDGIDSRLWGGQQNAGQTATGQQGEDSRRQSDATGAAARLALDDEILVEPAAIAALGPNSTFHTVA